VTCIQPIGARLLLSGNQRYYTVERRGSLQLSFGTRSSPTGMKYEWQGDMFQLNLLDLGELIVFDKAGDKAEPVQFTRDSGIGINSCV
jgi:hypothetical protein